MLDWLPENISTYGVKIDFLFYLIYYITNIIYLLVAGFMIFSMIKYRYKEGRKAEYAHGNNKLEIIWTSATTVGVLALALVSAPAWKEIKIDLPEPDIVVQVTAEQFNWKMLYPGPDNVFGTTDDLEIENELNVPVDKVVHIRLLSDDVIHSFFIPNLRLKQDILPGREIIVWFEAMKTGRYEIPCAELCGFGHSGMLGLLYVHSPDDYEAWVDENWPGS